MNNYVSHQAIAVEANGAQCTGHLISTMSSSLLKALNGDDELHVFQSMCFFNTSSDPLQRLVGTASCRTYSNAVAGLDMLGRQVGEVGVTSWETHKINAVRLKDRIKDAEDMIAHLSTHIEQEQYVARIVQTEGQATRDLVIETGAQTTIAVTEQLSTQLADLTAGMQASFSSVEELVRYSHTLSCTSTLLALHARTRTILHVFMRAHWTS